MARRRGQRKGYLYEGKTNWILEWREYHQSADGVTQKPLKMSRAIWPLIDPDTGRKVTRKEAERHAWELVLSKLEQTTLYSQSLQTVEHFIETKFMSEWVWSLKPAGKQHYRNMLKHVQPLYKLRLRNVTTSDVQRLVIAIIDRGLSVQTARHVRNVVSAIFHHAKATGAFQGENPAAMVRLPEMVRKKKHALDPVQAQAVFSGLPERERIMALLSMTSSLNVAELAAVRRNRLNLSSVPVPMDEEILAPHSLAVRENFYRGKFCSLKTGSRRRVVPVAAPLVNMLVEYLARNPRGENDLLFQNTHGGPVSDLNIAKRILRPLGIKIGLPFSLGWHTFRHTAGTLAEVVGMPLSDRKALLGHAAATMNLLYTHEDTERMRDGVDQMADKILSAPKSEESEIAELERLFGLGDDREGNE